MDFSLCLTITFMFDIICVTNRRLCVENFLTRIKRIAKSEPRAVILREKDLAPDEYRNLALEVMKICKEHSVDCILHSYSALAAEIGCDKLHMPLPLLCKMTDSERKSFKVLGASCHSVSDAKKAYSLGCTYITAGHVFETDCKRGLEPRGLEFLSSVSSSVPIPVYAIGGITPERLFLVREAGAAGACIMSSLMTCDSPEDYLMKFKKTEFHLTE